MSSNSESDDIYETIECVIDEVNERKYNLTKEEIAEIAILFNLRFMYDTVVKYYDGHYMNLKDIHNMYLTMNNIKPCCSAEWEILLSVMILGVLKRMRLDTHGEVHKISILDLNIYKIYYDVFVNLFNDTNPCNIKLTMKDGDREFQTHVHTFRKNLLLEIDYSAHYLKRKSMTILNNIVKKSNLE